MAATVTMGCGVWPVMRLRRRRKVRDQWREMEGGGKDGDGGQDLVTTEADLAPWRTDLVWGELAAVAARSSDGCRQRPRAHGDE